jgi:hypothetical protein
VYDYANITGASFNDGNWHHIVGVRNGTHLQLYLDKVAGNRDTDTGLSVANTGYLMIGMCERCSAGSGQYYFNGSMDNVLIFNRALTQAEITQLYNWRQP